MIVSNASVALVLDVFETGGIIDLQERITAQWLKIRDACCETVGAAIGLDLLVGDGSGPCGKIINWILVKLCSV